MVLPRSSVASRPARIVTWARLPNSREFLLCPAEVSAQLAQPETLGVSSHEEHLPTAWPGRMVRPAWEERRG
jgi:hypothetical protein